MTRAASTAIRSLRISDSCPMYWSKLVGARRVVLAVLVLALRLGLDDALARHMSGSHKDQETGYKQEAARQFTGAWSALEALRG